MAIPLDVPVETRFASRSIATLHRNARALAAATALVASAWCVTASPCYATVFGTGTYVEISDINGTHSFSNFGSTSQTDLLFGSIDDGINSDSISGTGNGGSGKAAADLATGTLKVFSTSSSQNTYVVSQAGLEDTLTATAANNGMMKFDITVTGTVTQNLANFPGFPIGIQLYIFKNGQSIAGTSTQPVISIGGEVTDPNGCLASGNCEFAKTQAPGFTGQFEQYDLMDVPVAPGDAVNFVVVLEADASDGTSDFSHTLNLNVSGVSFTSDSGVFLSAAAPPTSVPEPATMGLMLSGLLALGGIARRRRRA